MAALTVLLVCAVVALSASTAAVAAEQRRTAKQKDLAEEAARRANENYEIARGLTDELVTIVETRLPQVGGVEPVRKALLDAALPAFNRFLAGRPDDPDLMVWTARLHRYAANLAPASSGEADAAEPLYREAIRLEEALANQQPGEPAHRDRLAQTSRDHASLRKMVGRLSEASESLDRSAQVAEGLLAQRPEEPAFRRTLALTALEQSDVLYQRGRAEESLRAAGRAAELLRGLIGAPAPKAHPLDPLLFAVALNRVGAARLELGEHDSALQAHDEAAEHLRSMLKRADDPNVRHFLARTLLEQAKAFRLKEDAGEQAGPAIDAALGIWQELAGKFRNTPFYREFLALAHGGAR